MNIWPNYLLQELPDELLKILHMNICRIRSSPWRSAKSPASWVYRLPWDCIVWYHRSVMFEMQDRLWSPDPVWFDPRYKGVATKRTKQNLVFTSRKNLSGHADTTWEHIFKDMCPISDSEFEARLFNWCLSHGKL
jgi:uncharacterized protein (TIGR02328 family)